MSKTEPISKSRKHKQIENAATDARATVKTIAPRIGGAKLSDGSILAADGQLAGSASVLFDAVAVILSDAGGKTLAMDGAASDFVRDALGHLKAIAADHGRQALSKHRTSAGMPGWGYASDLDGFIAAARRRQWGREKRVRTLA